MKHHLVNVQVTFQFYVTECELPQRCVDFSVSRSSAICLHREQPEMGTVKDKGSPPLLQLRQTPVHASQVLMRL